jgi:hypothetical protein
MCRNYYKLHSRKGNGHNEPCQLDIVDEDCDVGGGGDIRGQSLHCHIHIIPID